jgi:IS30 family transposase
MIRLGKVTFTGHPNNRTGIPNRIDIDQRSDAVNNREVFGHWEADTIIVHSNL